MKHYIYIFITLRENIIQFQWQLNQNVFAVAKCAAQKRKGKKQAQQGFFFYIRPSELMLEFNGKKIYASFTS